MNLDVSLAVSVALVLMPHGLLFFVCSAVLRAFSLRFGAFLCHLMGFGSKVQSLNSEVLGFCFAVLGFSSGVFVFGSAACFRSAVWGFSSVATGL